MGLPLGLYKQACMKLDAFTSDLFLIQEDASCTDDDKVELSCACNLCGDIGARLLNIIKRECNEDEFLSEDLPMDDIDDWPEPEDEDVGEELLSTPIE